MDANKTAGEETRWQLHKNAAGNPEQVLAATPHKTPTVRPPAPYHEMRWDELIRDVLLWIPTHGRAKAGRPARTYIQQLCEDTGCCPEDLPRAMNDREEWRERVRDIRAASTIWWWWWYIYIFLSNFFTLKSSNINNEIISNSIHNLMRTNNYWFHILALWFLKSGNSYVLLIEYLTLLMYIIIFNEFLYNFSKYDVTWYQALSLQ